MGAWIMDLATRGTDAERSIDGLRALRFFLIVHASVRAWDAVGRVPFASGPSMVLLVGTFAVALSAAAALVLTRTFARVGIGLAAAVLSIELALSFPDTPNHVYLEYILVILFVVLDPDRPEEAPLLLQSLRWMGCLVLFHAGLQKLLYGYYFRGEFLAVALAGKEPFADLFAFVLPADELSRVRGLDQFLPGAGPFRIENALFVVLSNGAYLVELALPAFMLWPPTRGLATAAGVAFVLAIQLGAREVMFALLFAQLLLVCADGNWNRRLAPALALAYAYLLALLMGLVPGEGLLRKGHL